MKFNSSSDIQMYKFMFISNEIQILYAHQGSIHCIRMQVVTRHLPSISVTLLLAIYK